MLAAHAQPVPRTYREAVLNLAAIPGYDAEDCATVAAFTRLRNIPAHEYLDIRWPGITDFVSGAVPAIRRLACTTRDLAPAGER